MTRSPRNLAPPLAARSTPGACAPANLTLITALTSSAVARFAHRQRPRTSVALLRHRLPPNEDIRRVLVLFRTRNRSQGRRDLDNTLGGKIS